MNSSSTFGFQDLFNQNNLNLNSNEITISGLKDGVIGVKDSYLTSNVTTDELTEGVINEYFTIQRARNGISGINPIQYDNSSGQISLNSSEITFSNLSANYINYISATGSYHAATNFTGGTGYFQDIRTGNDKIHIGTQAGLSSQNSYSVAIGYQAGSTGQGTGSIAIGYQAGSTGQGSYSIAIGYQAGSTGQGSGSIAIGFQAGQSTQTSGSVSIGYQSGQTGIGAFNTNIGFWTGRFNQGSNNVAVGYQSGYTGQSSSSVAIGANAGAYGQFGAISIGNNAGRTNQRAGAIAIGSNAGSIPQGTNAIAIGNNAGQTNQSSNSIAIGYQAGSVNQQQYGLAIGYQAGSTGQASGAIALGYQAGFTGQQQISLSMGYQSGVFQQGTGAIAIGFQAGYQNQRSSAIALGYQAGSVNQNGLSVCIGNQAGYQSLGTGSIAIGYKAGSINQASQSIILTADITSPIDNIYNSGFYVKPVRSVDESLVPLVRRSDGEIIQSARVMLDYIDQVGTTTTISNFTSQTGVISSLNCSSFSGSGFNYLGTNTNQSIISIPDDTTNISIGQGSGLNSIGLSNDNLSIGVDSLKVHTGNVSDCIAIGRRSLSNLEVGYENVSIGRDSMVSCSNGAPFTIAGNISIGFDSLKYSTVPEYSFALGSSALKFSDHPYQAVAIGEYALSECSGLGNIGIGSSVFRDDTGISKNLENNTAIGNKIMTNIGFVHNQTWNNTFIGSNSGGEDLVGQGNVCLGYKAGHRTGGYYTSASNNLIIHNSDTGTDLIKGRFDLGEVSISQTLKVPSLTGASGYFSIGLTTPSITATSATFSNLSIVSSQPDVLVYDSMNAGGGSMTLKNRIAGVGIPDSYSAFQIKQNTTSPSLNKLDVKYSSDGTNFNTITSIDKDGTLATPSITGSTGFFSSGIQTNFINPCMRIGTFWYCTNTFPLNNATNTPVRWSSSSSTSENTYYYAGAPTLIQDSQGNWTTFRNTSGVGQFWLVNVKFRSQTVFTGQLQGWLDLQSTNTIGTPYVCSTDYNHTVSYINAGLPCVSFTGVILIPHNYYMRVGAYQAGVATATIGGSSVFQKSQISIFVLG